MADDPVLIVHVASSRDADQNEAQDHMRHLAVPLREYMDDARAFSINMQSETMWSTTRRSNFLVPPKGFDRDRANLRKIFINTVDEFVGELQKFLRERAQIVYLDFHTHGSPGSLDLGGEHFDIDDLDKLRNKGFEGLFAAGALISFLGCDIARYDPTINESGDGELFLAEFAYIFLKRNGGRAAASDESWHYKPAIWGPGIWKNDGKIIIAEVAPNASRAVLKGNFWLDEVRLRQQIKLLRRYLETRLQFLRDQQPTSQFEGLRHIYDGALKQLEFAEAPLRMASPVPYQSLHKAVIKIEDAEDLVRNKGYQWDRWLF